MNTFPNEGNSFPQSQHSLYASFAQFSSYFFSSLFLSHLSLLPLPQALVSIFLYHHLCTFFTLSIFHFHFSHLLTAIHQLFAISFAFPLFIISSIKSIYNTGSLNTTVVQPKYLHFKSCCSVSRLSGVSVLMYSEQYQPAK